MLDLQSLAVGYRNTRGTVLSGIDLSAAPGGFICILGRNGTGKSTLMRTIAGLQRSLDGFASLDGEDIASMRPATRARRISVVLTERQFNPGLRVEDVISLARQPFTGWQGGLAENDRAAIAEAVAITGVEPFLGRYFNGLSDGERQRVMIARALAQTPHLMILDEITAFLDLPSRVEARASSPSPVSASAVVRWTWTTSCTTVAGTRRCEPTAVRNWRTCCSPTNCIAASRGRNTDIPPRDQPPQSRKSNRGGRIRTGDLLLPKQARYRAAPRPVSLVLPVSPVLVVEGFAQV